MPTKGKHTREILHLIEAKERLERENATLEARLEDLRQRIGDNRELVACYKSLQLTVEALRTSIVQLLQQSAVTRKRWFRS